MLKTVLLPNILVETVMHFIFRIHRWIKSSKEQHLFETEIVIIVFTVTFDLFNASLLNKIDPRLLKGSLSKKKKKIMFSAAKTFTFKRLVMVYSSYFILYSTEEMNSGLELHAGK